MSKKKNIALIYFLTVFLISIGIFYNTIAQKPLGKLKLSFIHTVNSKPLSLIDSVYKNDSNESYKISKLKYYLFDFKLNDQPIYSQHGKYLLVNADKKENEIEFEHINAGAYSTVSFKIGVDSIDNCSGAQSGALDPINDMFWTWNSGYVFLKLEGTSPNSNADLNRLEYHLGGYKGDNALSTKIDLRCIDEYGKSFLIRLDSNKETEVVVAFNLDNFWQRGTVSIKENSICVSPGKIAKKLGTCFSTLFSIKSISKP